MYDNCFEIPHPQGNVASINNAELTLYEATADTNIMNTLLGLFSPFLHVFTANQRGVWYLLIHREWCVLCLSICVFRL